MTTCSCSCSCRFRGNPGIWGLYRAIRVAILGDQQSHKIGAPALGSPERGHPDRSDFPVFSLVICVRFLVGSARDKHPWLILCFSLVRQMKKRKGRTGFAANSEQIKETPFCRPLLQVPYKNRVFINYLGERA